MTTLAETLFTELADMDWTDTFCAELVAEWFVGGQLSNEKIGSYTDSQMAGVETELAERWDQKTADKFGDIWIEFS